MLKKNTQYVHTCNYNGQDIHFMSVWSSVETSLSQEDIDRILYMYFLVDMDMTFKYSIAHFSHESRASGRKVSESCFL